MKKILSIFVLLIASVALYAQSDVTKFLGIPVDGFKSDMIQKLKAKGFVSTSYDKDVLEGEFNGYDVTVYVGTNNNKVYRIMICDKNNINEADIKIRFNNLCRQFANNPKYISLDDQTIFEDEDIGYEMLVNKKRYEAVFYQKPVERDSITSAKEMESFAFSRYTPEEFFNLPEDELQTLGLEYAEYILSKKTVWFMISEFRGKYYITMYYDNGYNKANGEDL
ncbi:MAG: hypothetical protein IKL50_04125 [Bacteroidales bacterium]|nr:hypothetical protein [Bacteroidales bacterium]